MSTRITKCGQCESTSIKELNPEMREIINKPHCEINCVCKDCGFRFIISDWTWYGKRKSILY